MLGMTAVMNRCIYRGGEIIALPRFEPKAVIKAIDKKKPTMMAGVPSMYTALLNHEQLAKCNFSSTRWCISGGAPLPRAVKRNFEEFTGSRLVEGYGLSEASPVTVCNPFFGVNKEGSIGMPLPGTVIEIRSRNNPKKVLPLGETGEICVTGPQVMAGYWGKPEETEQVFIDGRLHTGDMGYMDEDGYVFLIDRIKDLILVGGYNVYPRTVEEAIAIHPAVDEVCVCGLPSPSRGQIVKAFVKLRDGYQLTEGELLSFLRDKLAPFELPKRVEFRDALPKTLIGKLSKEKLISEETENLTKAEAS